MRKITFITLLVLFAIEIYPQEKLIIDNGLAITTNPPGRRSLSQVDPIESMIVNNKWTEPKEDDILEIDTIQAKWFKVNTNAEGWFQDQNLRGSYIYHKFESDVDCIMILEGHGYYNVFVNGEPRIGNIYGHKDNYESWEPNFNYSYLPVKINKGKNEFIFQVSYGNMKAVLHETTSIASLNILDNTLPDVFKGKSYKNFGGIVVINSQNKVLSNAKISVTNKEGKVTITEIPSIIPLSVRKVKFNFEGIAGDNSKEELTVELIVNNKRIDKKTITLNCVDELDAFKETFISGIDGSVQYYAVKPSSRSDKNQALFLSLHGASVEAINQAGSYSNKEWGNIVCPTNRRPYGFNWEDVGRTDALEVLQIAKEKYQPDENRIYLTGHSMGGHGTWHLGVNYPDQFAAIGPSAGWISLWSYRYQDREETFSDMQKLYTRAAQQSDTYTLAENYKPLGIYIVHGDADSVVSPFQAKGMMRVLSKFHKDYDYHFEPGKEHWWDVDTVRPGNDCVDWTPLFDYFSRHSRSLSRIKNIKHTTATPGISSKNNWVTIEQQEKLFDFSNIEIEFIPDVNVFRSTTSNIKTFSIDVESLGIEKNKEIKVNVDGETVLCKSTGDRIYLTKQKGIWNNLEKMNKAEKNPSRYGSFKDLFKNNLVLVYGTNGTEAENEAILAKVRYDSEMFWYVGNGSFEIIPDKEFDNGTYADNNVLLYGNTEQNSAYEDLFSQSPLEVEQNKIEIKDKELRGDGLAVYAVYPKTGSVENLVGIVAGTGLKGMKLTYMRPFLKPGASFPDITVFNSEILDSKDKGISAVGFYGLDWSVENGEIIFE